MKMDKSKNKRKVVLYKGVYYIDVAKEVILRKDSLCFTCHLYTECYREGCHTICLDLFNEVLPYSLRRYPIGTLLQELKKE